MLGMVRKDIYWMGCRKFLDIKIPKEMVERKTDTALKRVKIFSSIQRKDIGNIGSSENPAIVLNTVLHNINHIWLDANSSRNG